MLEDYEEEFLKLVRNDMSRKTFMDALWDYKERPEELETFCRELAVFSEGYAVGRNTKFDKLFTSTYELTKLKEENKRLRAENEELKAYRVFTDKDLQNMKRVELIELAIKQRRKIDELESMIKEIKEND